MRARLLKRSLFVLFTLALLGSTGLPGVIAAQEDSPAVWFSNVIWYPSLEDAGFGLAETLNQIDAACNVDVDTVQSSNGAGPDGPVYGLAISWSCPPGGGQAGAGTWNSTMVWRPTIADAGIALAEVLNEIDGSCAVDVVPVVASNGAGPEGPVYAFAISWACRAGAPQTTGAWLSNTIWQPTFADAGIALSELLNQIESTCSVDVDRAVATNGATADGTVVAFTVSWSCPL